jgi:type VII secretion integral membrane protein EccD
VSAPSSRVTVVGAARRVDVVLPADEPVGRLLPDLLQLLDEPVGRPPRPRQLVTVAGDALAGGATLAAAGVADGSVLRLAGVDDSPPVPVVHDITEEAADDLERRSWRWGPGPRRWTATVAAAGALALAAGLVRGLLPGVGGVILLAAAGAAGCLLGVALAQVRGPVGTAVLLGGGAVALQAGWAGGTVAGWAAGDRLALVAAQAGVLLALAGVATRLGSGGVVAGGVGLALAGMWWVGGLAGLPPERVAAVMACVAVGVVGVLPRLAMAASGLTGLDDRRAAGIDVAGPGVTAVLTRAHRALSLSVLAVAASGAAAGWVLAASPGPWTLALALLLAVVLLGRARAYPLTGEVLALLGAAVGTLLAPLGVWRRPGGAPAPLSGVAVGVGLAVAGAVAATCVALLAADPPEHVKARARRAADRIEALAVVATLPVAVGVFGTYGRLLDVIG